MLCDSPSDGGASFAGAAGLSSVGAASGGAGVCSSSTWGSLDPSAGASAGASVLPSSVR